MVGQDRLRHCPGKEIDATCTVPSARPLEAAAPQPPNRLAGRAAFPPPAHLVLRERRQEIEVTGLFLRKIIHCGCCRGFFCPARTRGDPRGLELPTPGRSPGPAATSSSSSDQGRKSPRSSVAIWGPSLARRASLVPLPAPSDKCVCRARRRPWQQSYLALGRARAKKGGSALFRASGRKSARHRRLCFKSNSSLSREVSAETPRCSCSLAGYCPSWWL